MADSTPRKTMLGLVFPLVVMGFLLYQAGPHRSAMLRQVGVILACTLPLGMGAALLTPRIRRSGRVLRSGLLFGLFAGLIVTFSLDVWRWLAS